MFTVEAGGASMRLASESPALRVAVEEHFGVGPDDERTLWGLLLGRPADDGPVATPTWVLYESGDITLRRSRSEDDAVAAACFHLATLRSANADGLLALRLRAVVTADGRAVLASPGPLHALAGHDRRLAGRGCTVLPSTVVSVDPSTGEVVLPPQPFDSAVPVGRFPIEAIWTTDRQETQLEGVDAVLSLARNSVVTPTSDLQQVLDRIAALLGVVGDRVELLPDDVISQRVHDLDRRPRPA